MTKVTTGATMSLDGYIADASHGGFEYLFQWYENGDVETPTATPGMTFRTSTASAEHLRDLTERTGALVVGRRLFDMTRGWGGRHPMDVPVVVVTHSVPEGWERESDSFVFVTDGIVSAIDRARAIAGDKQVGVNGGTIAAQVLEAGLLDEVHVDLVPVLLGDGIPFFAGLKIAPVQLAGPTRVVEGSGVTHLAYRVRKAG
ncbi:dihydrofolate reductase family protein [Micromonospora soli]|uniref:dihydrofolate reductase family protein n=1 Tax=Micromonospora sp. NBRC 110009 TaxID=3061627 RepID=UPI0026717523|nr:dihydrofolate reductase family protein [Micromonospora sp. NBRC 110009]WKT99877.1 dihydrofolate reductase family protein [Micromonospora sp. NBRC 110009]